MKKIILIASILFICSQAANAQEPVRHNCATNVKQRVERLDKSLNLNDTQEKKITAIYTKYMDCNTKCTDKDRAQMHNDVKKVLNKDQQMKYDEMCKNGYNCNHHNHHNNHCQYKK